MRYPYLLFDADNTLYDFDKTERLAFEKLMQELLGDYHPAHFLLYKKINRRLWQAFEAGEMAQEGIKIGRFAQLIEALDLPLDAETMNAHFLQYLSEGHYLLDGAQSLIERLAPHHTIVIVTNGLKEVQRPRFDASPIRHHFSGIIVSDELGIAKPQRGIFDAAFEMIGQPEKQEVLMIGDSLGSDMQGGINYGIDTCWFNPQQKENGLQLPITHQVSRLKSIVDIVS